MYYVKAIDRTVRSIARRRPMTSKLHRDHSAETAMLAYRTGLSAAICKAWIEAPILSPAEAVKAALLPDGDDQSIIITRV
jgi:hypothetical protein